MEVCEDFVSPLGAATPSGCLQIELRCVVHGDWFCVDMRTSAMNWVDSWGSDHP